MKKITDVSDLYCEEGALPVCFCSESQFETSFPDLNFTIGGVNYYVPREQYVMQSTYLYQDICIVGMMSSPLFDIWILGLNFYKNYYTVFDQENLRVGFALSRDASEKVQKFHKLDDNLILTSLHSVGEQIKPQEGYKCAVGMAAVALMIIPIGVKMLRNRKNKSENYKQIKQGSCVIEE